MRAQRVMGHELLGDLFRERGIEATANIDRCQFPAFAYVVCFEFRAFQVERGLFGICL